MTIATAFAELRRRLHAAAETLRQLGLALDDVPDGNPPAVADALRTHADEIEGEIRNALAASNDTSVGAASRCQQSLNRAARLLRSDLASPDAVLELLRAGAERGGAWRRWCVVVREMLARSGSAIDAAADALAGCWNEFADRDPQPHRRQRRT